jgi:hypothetical protein
MYDVILFASECVFLLVHLWFVCLQHLAYVIVQEVSTVAIDIRYDTDEYTVGRRNILKDTFIYIPGTGDLPKTPRSATFTGKRLAHVPLGGEIGKGQDLGLTELAPTQCHDYTGS